MIREGRKTKEKVEVFSYELLAYRELINGKAIPLGLRLACALGSWPTLGRMTPMTSKP